MSWLCGLALSALVVAYLLLVLRDDRRFRRYLAQQEAARAAEAPCEALSHVRIVPPSSEGLAAGGGAADDDDLFIRMVAALNSFAEDNGYALPVPTLWMALATVIAAAILGEDLAAIVAGPGMAGGEAS